MTNLEKMLKKIIKENTYLLTKEQAEEYLEELLYLESKNKIFRIAMREIELLAKHASDIEKHLPHVKTNT